MNGIYLCLHLFWKIVLGKRMEKVGWTTTTTTNSTETTNSTNTTDH